MRLPPKGTPARRRLAALAAAAGLALVAGAAIGAGGGGGDDGARPRATVPRPRAAAPPPPAVRAAHGLSLRRQAGQLVVMRFDGAEPPAYVARALSAGRAAGVILF